MNNKPKYILYIIVLYFSFTCLSFAQHPGDLDKTFGDNGKVCVGIGGYYDLAQAVVLQKDGKIVVAGYGQASPTSNKGMSIARYLQNGNMDYDFGDLGVIHKLSATVDGELNSIVIQKDDKIVAVGFSISQITKNENITLVRLTENGQIDKSFGDGGLVVTEISSEKDVGESAAIQPDGKIVIVGTTQHNPSYDIVLIRYDEDGQLDPYFGNGGIVITDINSGPDIGKSIVIQSDGKLIVAGFTYIGRKFFMTLLRYDSNGNLDLTFGKGGVTITDVKGSIGKLDLALQKDGKIILVGPSEVENSHHFTVIRFNNNGTLDKSFGDDGVTKTIIGDFSEAESVAIDSQGNLIVAGTTESGNAAFVVAMYNQNGILNPDFGSDGISKVNFFENSDDRAHSMIIDSDGNIIVAGESKNDYTTFGLVRFIGK